ncbi:MAG TPA: hypothetical protein DEQ98_03300 [Acidobacteria bacterium]|nr:hypothetical protein [Acidobacteriota bacterium]HCE02244.1 hypothetical protein [Acidobacteriota bacterium]
MDTMLEMAAVGPGDYVMDLGSADGHTVIAAARLGARAVGVELDPQARGGLQTIRERGGRG